MAENGIWAAFRGQNKRHTWQGMVNTSIKVIVYIKLEVRKYQINQKWAIVVNFVLQSHQIVEMRILVDFYLVQRNERQ